ncbi:MAG: hypothetical protein ACOC6L_02595 [Thermodesulfobacteriota bacterium]
MLFSWPWNSLRKAYISWQNLERRHQVARQELGGRYVEVLRVAESLHLDPDMGLLRTVRLALDRPLDPPVAQARDRLQKAFAFLGKSFWRPVPDSLQLELKRYASHLETLCLKYEELGTRLFLVQKIIDLWQRDPAWGDPQNFRLALISPDAAWLFHQLREKRGAERQARKECRAREWRLRLAACQRWLDLLRNTMPASTVKKFERSLAELAHKTAAEEGEGNSVVAADQAKLDLLTAVANRQATRTIAELLPRKSN